MKLPEIRGAGPWLIVGPPCFLTVTPRAEDVSLVSRRGEVPLRSAQPTKPNRLQAQSGCNRTSTVCRRRQPLERRGVDVFELSESLEVCMAINGSNAADALVGTAGDDEINGLGGADSLFGDTGR